MSNNPYQTPQADVLTEENIPGSFLDGTITVKLLSMAGWLTVFYLLLSIPNIGLSIYAEYVAVDGLKNLSDALSIVTYVLSSYLLLLLRKFLHARLPGLNITLATYLLIIVGLLVLLIPMLIKEPAPTEYVSIVIYYLVLFIPAGLVLLFYGIKLVRVKSNYRHLKVYAWLNLVTGICFLSIVLFIFAIPLTVVSDIYMALLFFHGRRELRDYQA